MQPGRKARPNESKENQIKILGFPWILLVELGLINKLEPKKLKNARSSHLALSVVDEMSERTPFCLAGAD
jgi:hypothetical protein